MDYLGFPSGSSSSSNTDLLNVNSDIVPVTTDIYDVGRPAKRFRNGEFVQVTSDSFVRNGGTNVQFLMADGSVTVASGGGQGSNIYLYLNSTLLSGIPAASYIRFDNLVQASASQLVISYQARYGLDIDAFLSLIDQNSIIYIQDYGNASNYIKFTVNSVVFTANSNTICNVSYMIGEGTGLTTFGDDTPVFMSVFVDTASIDNRITTLEDSTLILESDTVNLQNKTRNITATEGMTYIDEILKCSQIEGSVGADLIIGTTNNIIIGQSGSLFCRIRCPLYTSSVNAFASGSLAIGDASSDVTISKVGSITSILGSCDIAARVNCPIFDVASAGMLTLGNSTATSLRIGKAGIITSIFGTLGVNTLDTSNGAGTVLNIGTSTATNISLGGTSCPTFFVNSSLLQVNGKVTCTALDHSASTLSIGTSTAPAVIIGRTTTQLTLNCNNMVLNQNPSNTWYAIPKTLWSANYIGYPFNSSAPATLTGRGQKDFLANYFQTGTIFKFELSGVFGTVAAAGGTMNFQLGYGASAGNVLNMWSFANANSVSASNTFNCVWYLQFLTASDESTCNINGILTYTDSVSMKTLPFITPMVTQFNSTIVNNLSFNLTATLSMSGTVYNYTVTQMR